MASYQTRPAGAKKVIELRSFLGVDFANEETEVDPRRSPNAPNMTADLAGRPEVRPGYETLLDTGESINGIHFHGDTMILHHGSTFSTVDIDENGVYSIGSLQIADRGNALSQSFFMNGVTYILDGSTYTQFDGTAFADVEGFVPTTTIARKPTGGGEIFEGVNLLTPFRKNSFSADGEAKKYQLDGKDIAATGVKVWINGTEKTEGFIVDAAAGLITFDIAPEDDKGVDSVVIQFAAKTSGRSKVAHCTQCALFGLGNDTRVFVTGDPENKNVDYMSGLYDPTYFPDTGYTKIGSDDTAIMGYIKQYGDLIIVKEGQGDRGGLFLRSAMQQDDGSALFSVTEGIQNVGAASRYAFANVNGDPVFLSENGVFGLATNSVTNQACVQNRSWYVNPRLTAERNLENAFAAVHGKYLMLAVAEKIYVANSEAMNGNKTGNYGYEWYYWTDIPVRFMREHEGTLYIGTEEGQLRRLKDPEIDGTAAYSDDEKGIDAMWTTPLLDGGNFLRYKTIAKKGVGILAKPYARSSGEIFFTTDKVLEQKTAEYAFDVFDFNDIDFNRFTFNLRDDPKVCVSPKKLRKVLNFQMGVRHSAPNEGFGILAMMITYSMGKYTK